GRKRGVIVSRPAGRARRASKSQKEGQRVELSQQRGRGYPVTMHTHRLWCLLVLLTATTAFAQPKITVDHQQPTVKTRMFDPRDPPADMPSLTGGEAAFCSYNIGAATSVAYSIRTSSDGRTC